MKKNRLVAYTFLVIFFGLALSGISFAQDEPEISGIPCEKCGANTYASNEECNIRNIIDSLPCSNQSGAKDELYEIKVYNSYKCSKCNALYPRDYIRTVYQIVCTHKATSPAATEVEEEMSKYENYVEMMHNFLDVADASANPKQNMIETNNIVEADIIAFENAIREFEKVVDGILNPTDIDMVPNQYDQIARGVVCFCGGNMFVNGTKSQLVYSDTKKCTLGGTEHLDFTQVYDVYQKLQCSNNASHQEYGSWLRRETFFSCDALN